MTPNERLKQIQQKIPPWFRKNARELPWRKNRDPYAIWVAEIMLQQTRSGAVGPFYKRFLRRFPTIRILAATPLGDVLKAWEGLGYYARARNMLGAAKQIVRDFGGRLPRTASQLRTLPGIGRYTAGAIASIAFDAHEPVLDGNVTRVLCRLFRIRQNPRAAKNQKKLWSLARKLIPQGKARQFNQGMMDLGATVCTPSRPRCPSCPLKKLCGAYSHNDQDKLPRKPRRRTLPHQTIAAGIIWKRNRILIDRRKPEGLLGGLWEFPGGKIEEKESAAAALKREVHEELDIDIEVLEPLVTVRHAYSHFRITLHAFHCRYVSGRPKALGCATWKWIRVDELDKYPFPKANHKIITALREAAKTATPAKGRKRKKWVGQNSQESSSDSIEQQR